jgi:glycosyltransferase involved in cell wall biosynthesis
VARLAFFSPVPPAPTGIADYSADVLHLLAGGPHPIDVFHDQERVDPERLPPGTGLFRASAFDARHRERPYDLAVYQMGNATPHLYQYPFLARVSGLLVLHELVLHHARAKAFLDSAEARAYAAAPGDAERQRAALLRIDEYRAELEYSYPGQGARLAEAQLGTTGDLLPYAYPLFRLPAESSRLVACHSPYMVEAVRAEVPAREAVHVPMPMSAIAVDPARVRALRTRLGIAQGDLVVGVFGLLTREKRPETVARAVVRARSFLPRLRLLLVGPVPDDGALLAMLERVGAASCAIVTGRVDLEELPVHIEAADVVAHLRYPTGRETSAALLRVLAQGRPTVVSDLEHLADIPDDAVVRAAVDDEEGELTRAILRLAESPETRQRLGRRAAAFVTDAHAPARCRDGYLSAIDRALELPAAVPGAWPAHWTR